MKFSRICLLAIPLFIPMLAAAQPGFCVDCLQIRVGPATKVTGPTSDTEGLSDIPLTTFKSGTTVHAYSAEGRIRHLTGSNVEALTLQAEPPYTLSADTAGNFDDGGVWSSKVVNGSDRVYGWYYAEHLIPSTTRVMRTVAYMESADGGVTFTKPNYPQNKVLSTPDNGCDAFVGADSIATVQRDGYQYAYFGTNTSVCPGGGVVIARSAITSRGTPGSWFKWYNQAWTSPGIDGLATSLPLWPTSEFGASLYTGANPYAITLVTGQQDWDGFRLSFSNDVTNFTTMKESLLLFNPAADVENTTIERIHYPSMANFDGGETWGSSFYLFHTYVAPGDSIHQKRYTIRRKVDVSLLSSPPANQVRVALSRYWNSTQVDHWTTTALPTTADGSNYALEGTVGYLFTQKLAGMHALEDCYIPSWGDHMVSTSCSAEGATYLRTLGYAWDTQNAGTIPLYRCYMTVGSRADHLVSIDPNCEGLHSDGIIGYVPNS